MPKTLTKQEFIERSEKIHSKKYDYSKVNYINNKTEVCIICRKHGEFYQKPSKHLRGHGCFLCAKEKLREQQVKDTEWFVENSKKIHGDEYDYSKVNYSGNKEKVEIVCKKHGSFWQSPHHHLEGHKCRFCQHEKVIDSQRKAVEEFIEEAKKVHGEKYSYEKVKYINLETPVEIICPIHGSFLQKPSHHLRGHGCYVCNSSKLENLVRNFLLEKGIVFEEQKPFEWLVFNGNLKYDFYLPKYKTAIECQGIQHFEPISVFGGLDGFAKTVERDDVKFKLSQENGVKVLYFSNLDIEYRYEIINNLDVLYENILSK